MNRATKGTVLVALAVTALGGCDRLGGAFDAFRQKRQGPDEFSIVSRAPLQIPGSTALPEPKPGTLSPLDPQPQKQAIEALLGPRGAVTAAGTGPDGTPATAGGSSRGEQALLSSAKAASASSQIRVQLEQDRIEEEESAEYEPPTLVELLSDEKETVDPELVLEPNAESRRLQTAGVAAPVNPFERAPVTPEPEEPEEFSYGSDRGRPNVSADTILRNEAPDPR